MRIWVIFGSRTPEHDVSIASAYAVMQAIKIHTSHDVIPLYITREWERIISEKLLVLKQFKDLSWFSPSGLPVVSKKSGAVFFQSTEGGWLLSSKKEYQIDCLRNICHGENGEDGCVSGLAQLINLPIVSVWTLAEWISLDKEMMKNVFAQLWLPLVPYLTYHKDSANIAEIESTLTYPLFVKPVNLGSSIWVSRAMNQAELITAIEVAWYYDARVMIENGVHNLQELNCSVMEKDGEVVSTEVEEPTTNEAFLTFEEKYTSDSGGTMKWTKGKVKVPAEIPAEIEARIKAYVKEIFVGCHMTWGAPRVDFLYDKESKNLYVNEVNVTPGSMQLPLRKASWRDLWEFVEGLIATAQKYHALSQKSIDHSSTILDHTITYLENNKK